MTEDTIKKTIIKLLTKIIDKKKISKSELNEASYIRHKLMGLIK